MLTLHSLSRHPANRRARKRVGRGNASGRGTTATRGTKGQRARTGGRKHLRKRSIKQLILHLPKTRGFHALSRSVPGIPLTRLLAALPNAPRIDIQDVRAVGLLSRRAPGYKVIGSGPGRKITVVANGFSASARKAIEAAGGTAALTADRN